MHTCLYFSLFLRSHLVLEQTKHFSRLILQQTKRYRLAASVRGYSVNVNVACLGVYKERAHAIT